MGRRAPTCPVQRVTGHVGQERREEAQRATTLSPYSRFFAAFSATFRSHSDRVIPSSAACLSIARNSASRNRIVIGLPCPVDGRPRRFLAMTARDLPNLAQFRPRQPFAPARLKSALVTSSLGVRMQQGASISCM